MKIHCSGRYQLAFVLLTALLTNTRGYEECKDVTYPMVSYCETIESWKEFREWVDESVPGDELYLCPFDIDKGEEEPLTIDWGLSIICVKSKATDSCILRGSGELVIIQTGSNTLLQSLDFQDGNDHAIHVTSSGVQGSDTTRTFCYCSFIGGGVFMTQHNAGTVNLFECYFADNFSMTRGAAIYTRTDRTNIIASQFVDNAAIEWGGAIYCAKDANVFIASSTYIRNYGLEDHAVVVGPRREGSSIWVDGGNNLSHGGGCPGFFSMVDQICEDFVQEGSDYTDGLTGNETLEFEFELIWNETLLELNETG